jgi:uncharacterized protein YndB with AHSA1/START domain
MKAATDRGYATNVAFAVPQEKVFDAIASAGGIRGWWTGLVTGSTEQGGTLRLEFEGAAEEIVLRVDRSDRPSRVEWTCLSSSSHAEWNGTRMVFELRPTGADSCELDFRHEGLVPELHCYDVCERGWDSFLGGSLVGFVERGQGSPFGRVGPLSVVRRYHDAWTSGDVEGASRWLSSELETEVPLNRYEGRDDFVAALTAFGALVSEIDLLAEFENGDEALLLYDLAVQPIGPMRVAEHFVVADGVITRIRHVHDTASLRDAGFAR